MIITVSSNDKINWNTKTETEKKVNEISNLLKTRISEIPFMRGVGISDEFIDNPITLIKPALINEITAVINDNTEGVSLHSVDILNGEISGDFYIKVVCEIE